MFAMRATRPSLRLGWLPRLMAAWLVLACVFATAAAEPAPLPEAPADGIYDDGRLLSEEQRAAAARAIAETRPSGVDIYLAAYGFLVGENIERRAERLEEKWCRDPRRQGRPGIVVVADASTGTCTYISYGSDTGWLTTAQLHSIFQQANDAAAQRQGNGEQIAAIIEHMAPLLREELAKHNALAQSFITRREWIIFGSVAAAAAGLFALGLLFLKYRGRVKPVFEPCYFPTVVVGQRYGAAFGGGVAAETQFKKTAEPARQH